MINNLKIVLGAGLILLTGAFFAGGCSSDSVAPHDDTPELTQENVAGQAAMVAMAITEIGPQLVNFVPNKTVYTYDFAGYDYVDGQVQLDFRLGGADGSSSTPSQADYAHLWTLGENGLTLTYETGVTQSAMYLTADLMADIDQANDRATILDGSGGILVSGIFTGSYAMDGLVVRATGYPLSGTLTFTGGAHVLVVTFNGSPTAIISADGATVAAVNLTNGDVTFPG